VLDTWVCSSCHSINREREPRCYKCRGPRSEATGEGAGLRPVRAIEARLANPYHSTVELAILAAALILGVIAIEIYTTVLEGPATSAFLSLLDQIAAGASFDRANFESAYAPLDRIWIPSLIVFAAALLAFAGWLSLTLGNVPALGGGEPSVSPRRAFVYAIIPGLNLRRVPSLIQEVLYKLDPRAGGIFTVAAAWIGLVGSWILARIVNAYLDGRLRAEARTADSAAQFAAASKQVIISGYVFDIAITAMISVGALALVVIIFQVERRAAARNREIEGVLGPT
jgi:hypothetical protein